MGRGGPSRTREEGLLQCSQLPCCVVLLVVQRASSPPCLMLTKTRFGQAFGVME